MAKQTKERSIDDALYSMNQLIEMQEQALETANSLIKLKDQRLDVADKLINIHKKENKVLKICLYSLIILHLLSIIILLI